VRLLTFLAPGSSEPRAGELRDGRVIAFGAGSVLDRLASGDREPANGESWSLKDVELLAPVPRPRAIFGIGVNYAAHARELGRPVPEIPPVFTKVNTASAPPSGPVRRPAVVAQLDCEAELALVMGANGQLAGFAVADDVTARDLQRRETQVTRAKGADTFCPWGPWITTADEVEDPRALWIRSWVNGELRQDAHTSDLIFTFEELIGFLREVFTLEPGDIILTGTPSGVGVARNPPRFLGPGDVVRIEIERLGAIEHRIEAA
jgi:acylpyruvate hydrolase